MDSENNKKIALSLLKTAEVLAESGKVSSPTSADETFSFPTEGKKEITGLLKQIGYMELKVFSNQNFGFFCSCCGAFESKGGQDGQCNKYDFENKSYSCCSGFYLGPSKKWVPAKGTGASKQSQEKEEAPVEPETKEPEQEE